MPKSMRKSLIITFTSFVLLVVTCIAYIGMSAFGWFQNISHLNIHSDQIYAVRQAYSNDIIESDKIEIEDEISVTSATVKEVYVIPGDLVYYSLIFKLTKDEYVDNKVRNLIISVNGEATSLVSATSSSGDYESFLKNCCIEKNEAILSVLKEKNRSTTSEGETTITYTPLSFYADNGVAKLNSDDTRTDQIIGFTSSTPIKFTNEGIASLLNDGGLNINMAISLPEIEISDDFISEPSEEEKKPDKEEGEEDSGYINFIVYLPIWYKDIGVNQNNEMDCLIRITGCFITPVIEESDGGDE